MIDNIKRPEVLAPCGEFESVIGAIGAGADAVYLGGSQFSARAYAKNLDNAEIIKAINYAHLWGKKVYLTLNTLIKNKEFEAAMDMLSDLYLNGLDAVIIQDLGLLKEINRRFPKLDIHISTQMSIMSKAGVEFFKRYNVTRVVPARELTASEIVLLKQAGLEIECFVHGAMCYCYSGKCLLSSLAGGRSGNRGRCAGPCRKPYSIDDDKKLVYPISMKDMCTITSIDKLIDAGVDSFKIEGRMKAPEYSAGVSSIYRKYVDEYCSTGKLNVTKNDLEFLSHLYIRSEIEEGYLNKIHGSSMISMSKPSYNGQDAQQNNSIREKYIENEKKIPVNLFVSCKNGEALFAKCSVNEISVSANGPIISEAINKALDEATIIKQFSKTGDTLFYVDTAEVDTDMSSFLPISSINEFRRGLFEKLQNELVEKNERVICRENDTKRVADFPVNYSFLAGIRNVSGLDILLKYDFLDGIIFELMSFNIEAASCARARGKKVFLRLPDVVREWTTGVIKEKLSEIVLNVDIDGIYVGGIDALMLAKAVIGDRCIPVIGDSGLWVFNEYAQDFVLEHMDAYTASAENNEKELKHFSNKAARELVTYGYAPVMYSANCVHNTITRSCDKSNTASGSYHMLYDDAGRGFRTIMVHDLCYNIIYNCVPTEIIKRVPSLIKENEFKTYRLEFSFETNAQMKQVLDRYQEMLLGNEYNMDENMFTNGHFKRGVE